MCACTLYIGLYAPEHLYIINATGNISLKALQKCLATHSLNVNFKHDKYSDTEKANTGKLAFNTLSRFTSMWNSMARNFAGHATVKVKSYT